MSAEEANFDSILIQLGTGKWNMVYYVMLSYWYACLCYHTLGSAFLAPKADFACRPPEDAFRFQSPADFQSEVNNPTLYAAANETKQEEFKCTYLVHDNTTHTMKEQKCVEWDFDNSTFVSTFTSEYNLVCQWEYLRVTFMSAYMFGVLFGSITSGYLSDRFGRRSIIMISTFGYSFIAIVSAWLPSVSTILTARFLLGLLHPASLQVGFILGMELTEPKYRTAVGMAQFLSWGIATMFWGAWAYLIREWRWLQLAVSLPCLLFLPTLWIMDESPRWLIVAGRHIEALKVLKRAKAWNGGELPSDEKLMILMNDIHKRQLGDKNAGEVNTSFRTSIIKRLKDVIVLFRTPKLRIITVSMCVNFFVVAMVFFGLNLSGGSFDVDPFAYMVIAGVVEIPGNTVVIPLVEKLGRKRPIIVFYFLTGASMLIQPFIPSDYNWYAITVAMIGKMSINTSFQILFLYITELFPTEVRTRGMGTAMMLSRGGAIFAPYIVDFIGAEYPWTAPVIFGASSIIAGLATLPLEETLNTTMYDTIADLEGYRSVTNKEEEDVSYFET